MWHYKTAYTPWLIFLFALGLRLVFSFESFWLDEAASIQIARRLDISLMSSLGSDFHPPLFYLLLRFWLLLVPTTSEALLRLPFVFLSTLTIPLVYYLVRELTPKVRLSAVFASLLLATSPFHVYYSVELRMYGLVTLFVTLSWYFLLRYHKSNIAKYLYFLATIASLYCFYGAVFSLTGQLVYLLVRKQHRQIVAVLLLLGLSLVPLLPLVMVQLQSASQVTSVFTTWAGVLGQLNLKNLFLIPLKLIGGRLSFEPKILYLLAASLWSGIVLFFAVRSPIKILFSAWFVVPILISLIVSIFTPVLSYHRFLYILPVVYVAFVLFIKQFKAQKLIFYTYFVLHFVVLCFYFNSPQTHREDWRGLSQLATATSLDIVISYPTVIASLVFYNHANYTTIPLQSTWGVFDLTRLPSEFIYTSYLSDLTDPDHELEEYLERNYQAQESYNLNQLGRVTRYKRL